MNQDSTKEATMTALIGRIADALDRMAPPPALKIDLTVADAFVWQAESESLQPVNRVNRLDPSLLKGIEQQKRLLLDNTMHYAEGHPANNALLWGARGTGKSSLVKAVHGQVAAMAANPLKLIEIHREDIDTLPDLMLILRQNPAIRFVIFCDDLSFDNSDTSYKSLKAVLEGGIEGRPDNVIFYATSNRRHLMPRDMMENERSTAINPAEAVEEKVSLSDRFGLWIGFHNCSQSVYLEMVRGYAEHYGFELPDADLTARALEWSATRGARSGRVAWQFIVDLAGRTGTDLS